MFYYSNESRSKVVHYEGCRHLKNIELGSRVEVSFAPNTNGKVQLTAIAVIE